MRIAERGPAQRAALERIRRRAAGGAFKPLSRFVSNLLANRLFSDRAVGAGLRP